MAFGLLFISELLNRSCCTEGQIIKNVPNKNWPDGISTEVTVQEVTAGLQNYLGGT